MSDGRNFEWPKEVHDYIHDLTGGWGSEGLLDHLKTYVDKALAAEYDRGYETALKMETDLQKDAWDEGFEDGTLYGKDLETMSGEAPYEIYEPRNPYA